MLLLLLLLEQTVSDIMSQKAVVTQDYSTPDVKSKHITPLMPSIDLPTGLRFCVILASLL